MYLLTLPLSAVRALPNRSYDDAEARRDVEPARHAGDPVELRAPARSAPAADLLLRDLTVEVLEPHAHVQGRRLMRPRILREDAEVGVQALVRLDRRVVDAHGVGPAVAIELHEVAVDVAASDVVAESPLDAGLERMRCRSRTTAMPDEHVLPRVDAVGRRTDAVPVTVRVTVPSSSSSCRSCEPGRRAAFLLRRPAGSGR